MTGKERRRELAAEYLRAGTEAGVYRIRNRASGRVLIGSSANLAGVRSRLAFAQSTRSPAALDQRLRADASEQGLDVFEFEVVDVLARVEGATPEEVQADLRVLEEMRRGEVDPASLY